MNAAQLVWSILGAVAAVVVTTVAVIQWLKSRDESVHEELVRSKPFEERIAELMGVVFRSDAFQEQQARAFSVAIRSDSFEDIVTRISTRVTSAAFADNLEKVSGQIIALREEVTRLRAEAALQGKEFRDLAERLLVQVDSYDTALSQLSQKVYSHSESIDAHEKELKEIVLKLEEIGTKVQILLERKR